MKFRLKYWILLIGILILIPILLNFVLQIPAITSIIGDSTTWLSFWASFISAIASFGMIFLTYFALRQNQEQINEIKRQWEDDHRPYLYCRIIVNKRAFFLQIYNPSSFDAKDVVIKFEQDFIDRLDQELKGPCINTQSNPVFIPAGKSWNTMIGWCEEINQQWKDLDFDIVTSVSYNRIYDLHSVIPVKSFVNRINIRIQTPVEDYLEDLAEGLVKPHSTAKYKTVQVALCDISKSLAKIATELTEPKDSSTPEQQ